MDAGSNCVECVCVVRRVCGEWCMCVRVCRVCRVCVRCVVCACGVFVVSGVWGVCVCGGV